MVRGAFVAGSFSINLSNGASISGVSPTAAGGAIAGNYVSAASTLPSTAAFVPFKSAGSSIAGIYEGRVHPTGSASAPPTSLTRLQLMMDFNTNIGLVETTYTGSLVTYVGGVGAALTATGGTSQPGTVSNAADHGAREGTITAAVGRTAMNCDVFKKHFVNRMVNLSTRGFVSTGQSALIGGFVIPDGPKHAMIIARGPSLTQYGVSPVLADPQVGLYNG